MPKHNAARRKELPTLRKDKIVAFRYLTKTFEIKHATHLGIVAVGKYVGGQLICNVSHAGTEAHQKWKRASFSRVVAADREAPPTAPGKPDSTRRIMEPCADEINVMAPDSILDDFAAIEIVGRDRAYGRYFSAKSKPGQKGGCNLGRAPAARKKRAFKTGG